MDLQVMLDNLEKAGTKFALKLRDWLIEKSKRPEPTPVKRPILKQPVKPLQGNLGNVKK